MKNKSLPHSDLKHRLSPSDVINNLIHMFSDPACPAKYRDPALELGVIFTLDATAETDLVLALFGDHPPDTSTRAGLDQFLDQLTSAGVIEQQAPTSDGHDFRLRFHAQALIDLLKIMPHRDPSMGIARDRCIPG